MSALTSTYRVQLRPGFGFDEVAALAPYLAALGISHLYASPYLQAAPGSTHGYDVVDPTSVSAELGGPDAHKRMCAALEEHGIGQILDVVPNHMAIPGRQNRWWWDVLKHGRESPYATWFDIDWDAPAVQEGGRILLPVLGDHYGRVLEAGELRLEEDGDELVVRYAEHAFPVRPSSMEGASVAEVNADLDALDAVLQRQHYRLALWRLAESELEYRRFFDINSLVGVRVEVPEVFDATHVLVRQWLEDGTLDGVRIDHIDGLADPVGYLERLRSLAPGAWIGVEKVLERGERLPAAWPVEGTTGYESMWVLSSLFIDGAGAEALRSTYQQFVGAEETWEDVARAAKDDVAREVLRSDVVRLTDTFAEVCSQRRRFRDFTRSELERVLHDFLVELPVYRTYVHPDRDQVTVADRDLLAEVAERVLSRDEAQDRELVGLLVAILTLEERGAAEAELVVRFQQASGPVMAKGVEDTACYRYLPLASINEVGGAPDVMGVRVEDLHEHFAEQQRSWPRALVPATTHDAKRSEDARLRISALSQFPSEWAAALERWHAITERHRRPARPGGADDRWPDRHMEHLLYQSLVGTWPASPGRLVAYMAKASHEAKRATSWTAPDLDYDDALASFVASVCADAELIADLERFLLPVVRRARLQGLSATALRCTVPGVPDTYQGSELWDTSLVDPDNRRPIDFSLRSRLLEEVQGMSVEQAMARLDEGVPKLLVLHRLLGLRRRRPALFGAEAGYRPVRASGPEAEHVVAFERGGELLVIVPRRWGGPAEEPALPEATIEVPEGRWRHVLTGEEVGGGPRTVAALLARFPVGVYEAQR